MANVDFERMTVNESNQHWYRVPLVWLVIGIPLFSVVFTLSIVWISIQTFDGVVVDDYYRKGLEINQDLARDRYASQNGIEAIAVLENNKLAVSFTSKSREPWPDVMRLGFYHPTVSNQDVLLTLVHNGSGNYSASDVFLNYGKWNIASGTDAWRLKATFHYPAKNEFHLKPVISGNVTQ